MTREEWEAKQNASKKEYKYVPTGNPGEVKKVESSDSDNEDDNVSDDVKSDWNNFLTWLDKKGLKGKPELDKDNKGNELFKQYLKENPNTSLTEKIIPSIRKAYLDLRDDRIKEIKAGKANFSGNPEDFMKHIVLNEQTKDPNYVGQHLTQTMFPGAKLYSKIEDAESEQKIPLLGKGGTQTASETLSKMK